MKYPGSIAPVPKATGEFWRTHLIELSKYSRKVARSGTGFEILLLLVQNIFKKQFSDIPRLNGSKMNLHHFCVFPEEREAMRSNSLFNDIWGSFINK